MNYKWHNKSQNEWLRYILSIHFHQEEGAPYWLNIQRKLGIDVQKEIECIDDLLLLGPMDETALAKYPIEEFIPRILLKNKSQIITAESGGTTGTVKHTAYSLSEFREAFSEFFYITAVQRNFPGHLNWLFAAPSGPHIIHRSAMEMAARFGTMTPFAIDFDPRWIKKFSPNSMPFKRYKSHIIEQCLRILSTQEIGVLFTTPDIALSIAEELSPSQRNKIRGIHLGGMPLMPDIYEKITSLYSSAVIIPGYGNTLFGLTLEISPPDRNFNVVYYPPGPRIIIKIIKLSKNNGPAKLQEVEYGERGRVMIHRLDETLFLPNLIERDEAERALPLKVSTWDIGSQDGIKNPKTSPELKEATLREGLY
ncbi:MAG: hypothetical protein D6734_06125 [Candidatus Schekmanbacteria bacterium]|nr:MAG: hypothetical protein D6734_06125 [Candidatus Schekmanbacteria bacterium]